MFIFGKRKPQVKILQFCYQNVKQFNAFILFLQKKHYKKVNVFSIKKIVIFLEEGRFCGTCKNAASLTNVNARQKTVKIHRIVQTITGENAPR